MHGPLRLRAPEIANVRHTVFVIALGRADGFKTAALGETASTVVGLEVHNSSRERLVLASSTSVEPKPRPVWDGATYSWSTQWPSSSSNARRP